ncbi:MAG: polysaccharide deacetylase family protein [Duganella sp.]
MPAACRQPALWVLQWIFRQVLGLAATFAEHDGAHFALRCQGRVLTLDNDFFRRHLPVWRQAGTVLIDPPRDWTDVRTTLQAQLLSASLPVLWGQPGLTRTAQGDARLHLDVVGSIFFMLSRYEEVVRSDRDQYGRFPAAAALAVQRGFLQRPIVDEYIEVLWAAMLAVWPGLTRTARAGVMRVSCDVDEPYERWIRNPWLLAQGVAGALARQRSTAGAARRVHNAWASRRGDYRFDPHWTFPWYLDRLEAHGCTGAFYFIPTPGRTRYDCAYRLEEPRMQALLLEISARGHEIGMHGSFHTFRDGALVARERQHLIAACRRAGASDRVGGNRQHYLRWDALQTADHLDRAGFDYDTTGGFPYDPGFRYGTAREFPMWSWSTQAPLRLRQRPLTVMENAVMPEPGDRPGDKPAEPPLAALARLKHTALRYGDFNLLWHNSRFTQPGDATLFCQILAA